GGADLSELKGLPIPVRIKGTYTKLDYDFDERAFRKAFTDKYKKQLKDKQQELKQKIKEGDLEELKKEADKLKEKLKDDDLKQKLDQFKKLF
ncbi:hypothetical protein, partial [Kaarinaea lacus]